jgi:hypothetical protein
MKQTVFLVTATLMCALGVSAQQHNIDPLKSTLTIHVGKTAVFSGFGHEHEVRAPIHSGTAETGSHPAVEMHVDARALRVIDKDDSEKDRAEVQKMMLGPEVLDSSVINRSGSSRQAWACRPATVDAARESDAARCRCGRSRCTLSRPCT